MEEILCEIGTGQRVAQVACRAGRRWHGSPAGWCIASMGHQQGGVPNLDDLWVHSQGATKKERD